MWKDGRPSDIEDDYHKIMNGAKWNHDLSSYDLSSFMNMYETNYEEGSGGKSCSGKVVFLFFTGMRSDCSCASLFGFIYNKNKNNV